jgi:hypothetical protein
MSDLRVSASPLFAGLDLSNPKLLVEPGSLLDCLNYEVVDYLGYRRIDGFARYDGNVCFVDIPRMRMHRISGIFTSGSPVTDPNLNAFIEDDDGNHVGFMFAMTNGAGIGTFLLTWFDGTASHFSGTVNGSWSFSASANAAEPEVYITQAQFIALDTALRGEVVALPYTPVGLHWAWRNLYAVVPLVMVPYAASDVNQVVAYEIGGTLTTDYIASDTIILDKIVTTPAGVSDEEEGYFLVQDVNLLEWSADADDTYELTGDVSVGAGSIYHQEGTLSGMDSERCTVWRAQRPAAYNVSKAYAPPGWFPLLSSYTMTVTLSGITTEFNALRRGSSEADATYYVDDGVDTDPIVISDYFIVSGSFAAGDAVIEVQFKSINRDITTAFDLYSDSGAMTKLADVTTRMSLNTLPGFPLLNEVNSRYLFITSNFYATEGYEAIYGVNGVERAFVISQDGNLSFIYTQLDEELDNPRHVENHQMHLALGFRPGSVQLSVVGQPTNFNGVDGASEFGVGDAVTGLMSLNGTTLGIFCEKSVWSIVGNTVDAFQTQMLVPKSGCLEYTLVNCGQPYYLDSRGLNTLSQSAAYGDFVGLRLSSNISSWLKPRLRSGVVGINNQAGIACAIPVRDKNQYRVFFNDGVILTATLRTDTPTPSFTWQKYYLDQPSLVEFDYKVVPFAWTSEVDLDGKERIFVAHFNLDSPVESNQVFALECGDGFDGNYIPHYITTNWYHKEVPNEFQTLHSMRLHGQSRGLASLKLQVAGAQNDYFYNGGEWSTSTVPINFPRSSDGILTNLHTTTNKADIAARGLGIQWKLSGSNTNLSLLEPYHVVQVSLMYFTPSGAFDL